MVGHVPPPRPTEGISAVPAPPPTAPPRSPTRPRRRRAPVLPLLAAGTLLTFVVSLGVGPVGMAPAETLAVLRDAALGRATTTANALVVTEVRLPR
ncbi:MAG TPA: hypothetical protein VKY91_12160, partial [Vulgatibacteraceae bacterium]|nr:hypothetical protein [Vulgatibacteraceae bacterium]